MLPRDNFLYKSFPRNPTDNLSFDPPAATRPFQQVYDSMVANDKTYNFNTRSDNGWAPGDAKTLNNRSSITTNIISHEPIAGARNISLLDKKVTNMKKGIAEFLDLNRVTAINENGMFRLSLQEKPTQFRRKNGVFTHLYDSAHRFGQDKPFKH